MTVKKLYVREGRRFVQAKDEDKRGMYFNADDTFTPQSKWDTIGVCVSQTPDYYVIICIWTLRSLYSSESLNYINIATEMFGEGRYSELTNIAAAITLGIVVLPTEVEMLQALALFKDNPALKADLFPSVYKNYLVKSSIDIQSSTSKRNPLINITTGEITYVEDNYLACIKPFLHVKRQL